MSISVQKNETDDISRKNLNHKTFNLNKSRTNIVRGKNNLIFSKCSSFKISSDLRMENTTSFSITGISTKPSKLILNDQIISKHLEVDNNLSIQINNQKIEIINKGFINHVSNDLSINEFNLKSEKMQNFHILFNLNANIFFLV